MRKSRANTTEEFQADIIGLIRKHYPKALQGSIDQSNGCASDMAIALGGILAQTYRLNGEVIGRTVLQTMVQKIVENATAIDREAGAAIRSNMPTLLQ